VGYIAYISGDTVSLSLENMLKNVRKGIYDIFSLKSRTQKEREEGRVTG
jgi:hypothetical protein